MKILYWILIIASNNAVQIFKYHDSSSYSVLCGCMTTEDTTQTLSCDRDEVIRMEMPGYYMQYSNIPDGHDCSYNQSICNKRQDTSVAFDFEERLEVYKNCTFTKRCDVNIKKVKSGVLFQYPYVCVKLKSDDNLTYSSVEKISNQARYFTGKDKIGKIVNCDCSITSVETIQLEIFFIYLHPKSCKRVRFTSNERELLGCTNHGLAILYSKLFIGTDLKLKIKDLKPVGDEFIYFKVYGHDLKINCGECHVSVFQPPVSDITKTNSSASSIAKSDIPDSSQMDGVLIGSIVGAFGVLIGIVIVTFYHLRLRKKHTSAKTQDGSIIIQDKASAQVQDGDLNIERQYDNTETPDKYDNYLTPTKLGHSNKSQKVVEIEPHDPNLHSDFEMVHIHLETMPGPDVMNIYNGLGIPPKTSQNSYEPIHTSNTHQPKTIGLPGVKISQLKT